MHFVIAGSINCSQYTYAVMVAQRLKETLPNFTYLKIPKKPEEWGRWLVKTCNENNWYHVKCPLIWREVGLKQGKKEFIGDINKFLDLCYDYYGVPRDVLSGEDFNRGEMDWFANRTEEEFLYNSKYEAKKRRQYRSRQVCITGASSQIAEIIIMELLKIPLQSREDGLEIRLFDEPIKGKRLQGSVNDAKYCPGPSGLGNCRVAHTLKDAFNRVDLVIVLDSYARKPKESVVKWLKRNRNAMCALGKALNNYASPHCRVIIGSPSNQPICYNATVLASFATNLHVRNIVAVTQDLGREMLKSLSTKIGVPIRELYCPPVWGFIGLNKYVDMNKTLRSHVYKVPGKRMSSTLPQGTEESELRMTECIIGDDEAGDITVAVSESKTESYPRLGRLPCWAKATAIIDLLKVWGIKQEDGNGEILCLGVYSDGTFNIPQGIYWSQPVILKKGFWVPFADYPIPRNSAINCYYLFLYSVAAIYRTKVKPRIYIPPVPEKKPKEKKKFDFDAIAKEVGMPVIRTDRECLNHLKYLAKKELGIDFDAFDNTIEEESEIEMAPSEEINREQIYCECWRQELKELQKIVFDRSSTTEVEVDLSSNVSGSEWSVINPNKKMSQTEAGQETEPGRKAEPFHILSETGDNFLGKASRMGRRFFEDSSSSVTVCSCGALSNGSQCRCLDTEKKELVGEEVKLSTEHFYQEQNAEVFIEDLKDVIYADSYRENRHVTFDEDLKSDELEKKPGFKFYGRKDAIRDEEADLKMRKRIMKYEEQGEKSSTNEEDGESERKEIEEVLLGSKGQVKEVKDVKFEIRVEGTSFDIIGDENGFENLDEAQKAVTDQDSCKSFRQMYTDEVAQAIQMLPPQTDKSTESFSENDFSIPGEQNYDITNFKNYPELAGEGSALQISLSLTDDFEDMDGMFSDDELEKVETPQGKTPALEGQKRQGIPLCCMCRCIVPEGLPCCPCGASTVVEVFKKESLEVFVQSEEDISFKIQYIETRIPPESVGAYPSVERFEQPEEKIVRDLPPESFFPFSPKLENKFSETERPKELTKEYIDSLKEKPEIEISKKCAQLLEKAKRQLEKDEEKSSEEQREKVLSDEVPSALSLEEAVGMDYIDSKLLLPDGIEDWRSTVQKKYREWFFEGTNIRDDSYYDIAIEEVSEDEWEIDKELEQYFEN